ncbi:MAG: dinucleotide-utilizing enzyme [Actinobacteria bacterium]|nr:dinucleotide-utilizing enzyme [Actinomycetota bacterium]
MANRPRLIRSIPYWILIVGSVVSAGYGTWVFFDKVTAMTNKLTDGSATGVEVYGGQAWITFAAAFVAAGLLGLVAALTIAVARSLVPAAPVEVVEPIDWTAQDDEPEIAPVTPAAAPTDAEDATITR